MDQTYLLELAKQTVMYLSSILAQAAGTTITDEAKQLARRTWQLLQRHFLEDEEATDDLAHYAKKPDSKRRQAAVIDHIVAHFAQDEAAVREVSQLVQDAVRLGLLPQPNSRTHHLTITGNAQVGTAIAGDVHGGLTVGPVTFGDQIDARNSQGMINRPSGPVTQNVGSQRTINTGGGDYAEGNIDKRGGTFVEGGTINTESGMARTEPAPSSAHGTRADGIGTHAERAVQIQPRLEFPATLAVGSEATLVVRLAGVPHSIAAGGSLTARLTARGFTVHGDPMQPLALDAAGTASAHFAVIAQERGPRSLRIDLVQQGEVLDSAFVPCRVVTQDELAAPRTPPIDVGAPAPAADLELRIRFDQDDERVLHFTLRSPNHRAPFHDEDMGTVRLRREPRDYLKHVYESLSKLARAKPSAAEDVEHNQHLAVKIGRELWEELMPKPLKDAFWQIGPTVQTLLITSDEPWIPWELIKPYRFSPDTSREDEPFWCERFSMARWLTGSSVAPVLPIRRVQPVAPGNTNLAHVPTELGLFNILADDLLLEVAAPVTRPAQVVQLFESGDMHLVHVAAHGGFDNTQPDNAAITLTDGSLKPSDVVARFDGHIRTRPLVFINACHGARADFAFTGLGGWANRLVRHTHVGAFIGAAWEVDDRLALLFAQTFYAALLRDHESIGESFRQARQVVRDAAPANSTWLAYMLYADPLAHAVVDQA